nr:MAG TPA: hypothetical protein [Caudoviricetes sp.]
MYKRFLNNADYLSIVTEEALSQLIRGREDRLAQAEEAAEQSIVEYLTDNYEIEKVLEEGKNILEYDNQITYPVGAHFYHDKKLVKAMRTINGRKAPTDTMYWEMYDEPIDNPNIVSEYWQTKDYIPGDIVYFANAYYICKEYNGLSYGDIRVPGVDAWKSVDIQNWEANVPYEIWDVVEYDGNFYTLVKNDEDIDLTVNPYDSEYWGMVGDYDATYQYEFSDHEYVVYNNKVYVPSMSVNADVLKDGYNIHESDPRNANVKKHMLRLAVYELHKLISPNNVSSARITDYETSITWLRDASRLKINPHIPRKLDEDDNKPVTEYAIATFARDYDPNKNPWQI